MHPIPLTIDPTAATEAALDVESLKEMMDALDPAAMLPEIGNMFYKLAVICRWAVLIGPIVLLVLGLCYLLLSPKEANYYFGYRCYFGMGSVNAWRFTQRMAGMLFSLLGLGLTVVMYVISARFSAMEVHDMAARAALCLAWEAGLTLLATLTVNFLAMHFFDRKGEYRRKPRQKKRES